MWSSIVKDGRLSLFKIRILEPPMSKTLKKTKAHTSAQQAFKLPTKGEGGAIYLKLRGLHWALNLRRKLSKQTSRVFCLGGPVESADFQISSPPSPPWAGKGPDAKRSGPLLISRRCLYFGRRSCLACAFNPRMMPSSHHTFCFWTSGGGQGTRF